VHDQDPLGVVGIAPPDAVEQQPVLQVVTPCPRLRRSY